MSALCREAPLISFIIPAYNETTENLKRCVGSVLQATGNDVEALVIDDGSETFPETEAFAPEGAEDGRLRVFHAPHQGVSAARNRGLKEARGRWIAFADSDDAMAEGFLSLLKPLLTAETADIVVYDSYRETMETPGAKKSGHGESAGTPGAAREHVRLLPYAKEGTMAEDLRRHFLLDTLAGGFQRTGAPMLAAVWNKVFRADYLRAHALLFPEALKVAEDTIFVLDALTAAEAEIYYLPQPLYVRTIRMNSAMHRYQPYIRENDRIFIRKLRALFKDRRQDPDVREALKKRYVLCTLGVLKYDFVHPDRPGGDGARVRGMRELMREKPYGPAVRAAQLSSFRRADRARIVLLRLRAFHTLLILERRLLK